MMKFNFVKVIVSGLLLFIITLPVSAQNEIMRVYHNGNVIFSKAVTEIDSITFNTPTSVTFNVYSCNLEWTPQNEPYSEAENAEITIFNETGLVKTCMTDQNGQAVVSLAPGNYFYLASKDTEHNISTKGYIIKGIFLSQEEIDYSAYQSGAEPGDLKFYDLNGDGIIDSQDSSEKAYLPIAEKDMTIDVYIAEYVADVIDPEIIDYQTIKTAMERQFTSMLHEAWIIDAALTHDADLQKTAYNTFSTFNFSPDYSIIYNLWSAAYRLVQASNWALEHLDNIAVTDEATKAVYGAEIRYFRAYAYITLLNYFGGVPLVTTTSVENQFLSRAEESEVENFVLSELDIIANSGNTSLRYSSLQLKNRVLLRHQNYINVINTCRTIIDSGIFRLPADHIWGGDAIGEGYDLNLPAVMQKGTFSYPIRYAETLLMYAEAINELNGPQMEAIEFVNRLEAWKEVPLTNTGISQNELRMIIQNLRTDLFKNEGLTFAMLKQSGNFLLLMSQYGATTKHTLLPIPQQEIGANPNMIQNPGW